MLSADPQVREPREHLLRVTHEAFFVEEEKPGTLVVRPGHPLELGEHKHLALVGVELGKEALDLVCGLGLLLEILAGGGSGHVVTVGHRPQPWAAAPTTPSILARHAPGEAVQPVPHRRATVVPLEPVVHHHEHILGRVVEPRRADAEAYARQHFRRLERVKKQLADATPANDEPVLDELLETQRPLDIPAQSEREANDLHAPEVPVGPSFPLPPVQELRDLIDIYQQNVDGARELKPIVVLT